MKRHAAILLLAAVMIPTLGSRPARSENAEKTKTPELVNERLDRLNAAVDGKLSARNAKLEQNLRQICEFQIRMKQDRLNYERQMAEEAKAFYFYMKSMKIEEREQALSQFMDKQSRNRRKFDRDMLAAQKKWFAEKIEDRYETADIEAEASPASSADEHRASKRKQ